MNITQNIILKKVSTEPKPNYIGKFHYPPEIDDDPNDPENKLSRAKANDSETTKSEDYNRPKSSIVKSTLF